MIALATGTAACGPLGPSGGGAAPSGGGGGPPPGATDPSAIAPGTEPEPGGAPDLERSPEPAAAGALPAEAQAMLDLHNRFRATHCAAPLTWSDELATVAQQWANKLRDSSCAFEHSRTRYGENLAMGTSGALTAEVVVGMWYREVDGYDFRRARFDMATGHFTQLVWAGTTRLGCARALCGDNDIVVCNYDPPGNVETQFADNVRPASCKKSR